MTAFLTYKTFVGGAAMLVSGSPIPLAQRDVSSARRAWQDALAILDDLHPAEAAEVRAKLQGRAPRRPGGYISASSLAFCASNSSLVSAPLSRNRASLAIRSSGSAPAAGPA
jgi:hypothetical protein